MEVQHESHSLLGCWSSVRNRHNLRGSAGYTPIRRRFRHHTVIFGVGYLIIGVFLFRNNKTAYYFGAIVPLIRLCGGLVGMLTNFTIWMAFLIAIDAIIALSCFYLIRRKRSASEAS